MSRGSGWVETLAVVVAAAASAVITTTPSPGPSAAPPQPSVVSPPAADLACPPPPPAGGARSAVAAAGAPGQRDGRPRGSLTVRPLSTDGRPLVTTRRPGRLLQAGPVEGQAVAVVARERLAPGAFAAATSIAGRRTVGLAVTACQPARDEWWFSGADTTAASTTTLVLSNPTPAVAVADLTLYGPQAAIRAPGSRGIPVGPYSAQVLDLARFAPGREALSVRVTTERGRVSAAVSVVRRSGRTATGTEWLPPAAAPDTDVVVSAGALHVGSARLVVVNPGEGSALMSLRVLADTGTFTPTGLRDVRVGPGRTLVLPLNAVPAATGAALRLTSTAPVTGVTVSDVRGSGQDLAVAPAGSSLTEPAGVPLPTGLSTTVAFAAVSGPATRAAVRAYDERGRPVRRFSVSLRPTATTSWSVPTGLDAAYLVITIKPPTAVVATAVYRGSRGVAVLPVSSAIWTARRPAVLPAG